MVTPEVFSNVVEAGLSENEARVYIAALSLGPSSVKDIAKHAGLKRTTVYPIFESLQDQGLMNIQIKGFKRNYAAEDPSRLEGLLEKKKQRLTDSLAQLATIYGLKHSDTAIKHYDGIESTEAVYNSLLNDVSVGEDYYIFSSLKDLWKTAPDFFSDFLERRGKLNIKVKAILIDSAESRKYKETRECLNEEVRLLPANTKFTGNFVAIPKKVLIHHLTAPVWAMSIENRNVVQVFQEMFRLSWNSLADS